MNDGHDCHAYFERTGSWDVTTETVVFYGDCTECHRPLKEVYDYTGTMDDESGEWINRLLDETERQLHDLLSKVIARGRTGEWRESVTAMQELDDKLTALIAEGGA